MMRPLLLTFAVVPMLLVPPMLSAQESRPSGIAWQHDLAAAIAQAREAGKPVIAYFTFDT
jgi:hypothetical protein